MKKNNKESIKASALHFLGEGTTKEDQPNYIAQGIVVNGKRHRDCKVKLEKMGLVPRPEIIIAGFITSLKRFVCREEAAKIAFEAKQISKTTDRLDSYMIFPMDLEKLGLA